MRNFSFTEAKLPAADFNASGMYVTCPVPNPEATPAIRITKDRHKIKNKDSCSYRQRSTK